MTRLITMGEMYNNSIFVLLFTPTNNFTIETTNYSSLMFETTNIRYITRSRFA